MTITIKAHESQLRDTGLRGLDLFVEVLARIYFDQQAWDQGSWGRLETELIITGVHTALDRWGLTQEVEEQTPPTTCGTAYCAAGWATQLTGQPIKWYLASVGSIQNGGEGGTQTAKAMWYGDYLQSNETVPQGALRVLELPSEYAQIDVETDSGSDNLFRVSNSYEDLFRIGSVLYGIDRADLHSRVDARITELTAATPATATTEGK